MSLPKPKFPREFAVTVAEQLEDMFRPLSERFKICGSIRRHKPCVSDIEVVYIPKIIQVQKPGVLFAELEDKNLFETQLDFLIAKGHLVKRKSQVGNETWGVENKLAKLTRSLIPVDFFATTERAWWTNVCCRTGGADNNTRLARTANDRGWKWHPTRGCFTRKDADYRPEQPELMHPDNIHWVTTEEDNFTFVGLPYLEPWKRL
jgi:DNA polymerase/3'-5' exonuclease PolX